MEKLFLDYFHLPSDLALWLTLSGSNYPYLEQISMVPKMFEPLKFDCTSYDLIIAERTIYSPPHITLGFSMSILQRNLCKRATFETDFK